mmetsp:Transcript_3700/g.10488  ORF Transcript_3700/g.10488 Transcript_3700/m.10488 type:complete len:296 (+) Transcript_3700:258-1145(+)
MPPPPPPPPPTSDETSPHGQLLAAYAALKVESEQLSAKTVLQETDLVTLRSALDEATQKLSQETERADELEVRLSLKTASVDCQLAENEATVHYELADAWEKNADLETRCAALELNLAAETREKEALLQRTAALARRDQLQKAALVTSNKEILDLTGNLERMQERFSELALRATSSLGGEVPKDDDGNDDDEGSQNPVDPASIEEDPRIKQLEALVDELQTDHQTMKTRFVRTLEKHQNQWRKERKSLEDQISELVAEKDAIEKEVAEIADLLERDHRERRENTQSENSSPFVAE